MKNQNKKSYPESFLAFAFLSALMLQWPDAQAGCLNNKPVCGSNKICVSSDPSARSGRNDRNSCLPAKVCKSLLAIAEKYAVGGKKLEIASADRSRNNAARGGASRSHHKSCNAADFLVPNRGSRAVQRELAQFMVTNSAAKQAGKNVYCTGRAHTSISPREHFYSSCVMAGKKRKARASRQPSFWNWSW